MLSLLFTSLVIGFAAAQNSSAEYNSTYIVPTSVDLSTRASWCTSQQATCNMLCGTQVTQNTCASDTLIASCICGNGTAPYEQGYQGTLVTFECNEAFAQCNKDAGTSADANNACKNNIQSKCGTMKATDVPASSSSSAQSSTSMSSSASGSATAASTSASATAAAVMGREYGTGAFIAGLAGAVGLIL